MPWWKIAALIECVSSKGMKVVAGGGRGNKRGRGRMLTLENDDVPWKRVGSKGYGRNRGMIVVCCRGKRRQERWRKSVNGGETVTKSERQDTMTDVAATGG